MTRPTVGLLHSAVMDAARPPLTAEALAAVRALTPDDLRAVIGFEPYQGMERTRGHVRVVERPAQFPTT